MAQEIEKKYLIREGGEPQELSDALRQLYPSIQVLIADIVANGTNIKQGYLPLDIGIDLAEELHCNADFDISEARLRNRGGFLTFTIKGEGGTSRGEVEKEIDKELFEKFWGHTNGKRVEKIRLRKPVNGNVLELDFYTDRDLIVAEMEVGSLDDLQGVSAFGQDISENKSYKNKNLAR